MGYCTEYTEKYQKRKGLGAKSLLNALRSSTLHLCSSAILNKVILPSTNPCFFKVRKQFCLFFWRQKGSENRYCIVIPQGNCVARCLYIWDHLYPTLVGSAPKVWFIPIISSMKLVVYEDTIHYLMIFVSSLLSR